MESQPEPTPSAQATVYVFFPQTFKGYLLSGGPEDAKINKIDIRPSLEELTR